MKPGDKLIHAVKGECVFVASFDKELAEVRLPSGVVAVVSVALLSVAAVEKPKQAAG